MENAMVIEQHEIRGKKKRTNRKDERMGSSESCKQPAWAERVRTTNHEQPGPGGKRKHCTVINARIPKEANEWTQASIIDDFVIRERRNESEMGHPRRKATLQHVSILR